MAPTRPPLTRDRVIRAALEIADQHGLDALTMRRLGSELGVTAMSLYKHVPDKDAMVSAMLDHVIAQIDVPAEGVGWREAMERRAASARTVLGRHSWALGLLEERGVTGPVRLRYLDAVLGVLLTAGFSIEEAAHAFWLLDSFVYGHVLQEVGLRQQSDDDGQVGADELPHLTRLRDAMERTRFSLDQEFDRGLRVILDAIDPG
ncbi:TetR/AcrR family transcriptional regulator [Euzebya tangerina]|uniref:TetR/AcrR family transcriptional regulator n=1 Tax=Euzebya tangerina TaxID=591198 RepID=UPI000E31DCBD|nr:TetR/AcrR family transcriptional regulator [Euzebya tangerina]